ncbi:MAG: hypothetical protein Ta2B_05830 [Termitinemataceae bacterium]|nr:MAG: hypothetical protein Ta2B_05830 [Termitinemataceae bacterium]
MSDLTSKRLLGVVVPLAALRTSSKSAIGEYPDLIEFAEFVSKQGIKLIQILPVNDTGYESSPYSALSAFALNPIYIKLGDLVYGADFKKQIAEFNEKFSGDVRFNYYKVAKAKLDLLWDIFAANKDKIEKDTALKVWTEKNEWVKPYAVFRKLKDENEQKSWKAWKTFSKIKGKEIDTYYNDPKNKTELLFWRYVQFVCDKQFSAVADKLASMNIILKGDLPILLNDDSCDVWSSPEYFCDNLSAGAPPDFYSPDGQNWGFPTYNWPAQQKDDFAWWKARLKAAERYFKAYRIDHILGFFRIWATKRSDISAMMGRYVPYIPIKYDDLAALGYDDARINWICASHIPTHEVWDAVQKKAGGTDEDIKRVFETALVRINNEELWLFKTHIKSEKEIVALGLHPAATEYLLSAWKNRIFFEYEKDLYAPVWYYKNSRSYQSFNDEEKAKLDEFLQNLQNDAEHKWEAQGKKLLTVLAGSTSMLACAEDLGAVCDCVPRVLEKLNILSLRVVRWMCDNEAEGQAFLQYADYPKNAVCTTSLHDSTTLRSWWEGEARQDVFAAFNGAPSLPKVYTPGTARLFLKSASKSASLFFIVPLIDLLHLSPKWYADDPSSERINIPGTLNDFNWTWRIPAPIAVLAADPDLQSAIKEIKGDREI